MLLLWCSLTWYVLLSVWRWFRNCQCINQHMVLWQPQLQVLQFNNICIQLHFISMGRWKLEPMVYPTANHHKLPFLALMWPAWLTNAGASMHFCNVGKLKSVFDSFTQPNASSHIMGIKLSTSECLYCTVNLAFQSCSGCIRLCVHLPNVHYLLFSVFMLFWLALFCPLN